MSGEEKKLSRRDLLKSAPVISAGLGLTKLGLGNGLEAEANAAAMRDPQARHDTMMGVKFEPRDRVRLAIVGVGLRGTSVLGEFLNIAGVEVTAICDIVKEKCERAAKLIEAKGQKPPAIYANGDHDFENLAKRGDIDFVYTATPWEWHVPVMLAALNNGHHGGTEVPAAYTVEDCWRLVEASEKNRRHCMIMENCCYGYTEMMVLNMVRAGLLGELVHGECAYDHDLREILFEDKDEGLWRRAHHTRRDANLYPMHGLGPVANYMDINRGDRFDYMVSMSSAHLGLEAYRKDHVPAGDPKWREVYKCGDYNTSLIKTARGRTIMLQHNVSTPRPYDRINLIQGTKGIFRDYPPRVFVDHQGAGHDWAALDKYKAQYEHPLWNKEGEMARKLGGHGGMDYIMCYRLVECMRQGLTPDMDVYDAAAWSVPGPLSERSVAGGSVPVKFPDFTRGRWEGSR
jgi:Glycosyl hydrolase 109, C-terminal domain/Oxidoreductase family, NAD-binding Rossmann fold